MRIEVKYESSQGPHLVDLSENVLEQMINSGDLSFTEEVGNEGNTKTTTIPGSDREKWIFAQALLRSMDA